MKNYELGGMTLRHSGTVTPNIDRFTYLAILRHVLSDHRQYFLQRTPGVLFLKVFCKGLEIHGTIVISSMGSKTKIMKDK